MHAHEITILYQFHDQKALFKNPQNLQYKFWIENDPLPFELFQKFLRFGTLTRPVSELKLAFKKYKSVWVTNSRKLGKCSEMNDQIQISDHQKTKYQEALCRNQNFIAKNVKCLPRDTLLDGTRSG